MRSELIINTDKGPVPAFLAKPDHQKKSLGIILIHEVWGLTPNIRDVAGRLAEQGYLVLAPDLISHTGITEKVDQSILAEVKNPATRDEAQKKLRAAMAPIMAPEFAQDTLVRLHACLNYLTADENCGKVAVMGFCFGGTYAWNMAISEPSLKCAVAFYGHAPLDNEQLAKISCPVLAFYGEKDEGLVKLVPQIDKQMNDFGKNFEYKIYPNCGHAFFNDTNPATYNREAADDSWIKTQEFLSTNLR